MSLYYSRMDSLQVGFYLVVIYWVWVGVYSSYVVVSIVESGLFHQSGMVRLLSKVVERVVGVLGLLSGLG